MLWVGAGRWSPAARTTVATIQMGAITSRALCPNWVARSTGGIPHAWSTGVWSCVRYPRGGSHRWRDRRFAPIAAYAGSNGRPLWSPDAERESRCPHPFWDFAPHEDTIAGQRGSRTPRSRARLQPCNRITVILHQPAPPPSTPVLNATELRIYEALAPSPRTAAQLEDDLALAGPNAPQSPPPRPRAPRRRQRPRHQLSPDLAIARSPAVRPARPSENHPARSPIGRTDTFVPGARSPR
jgi:hypothetical protein